MEGALCVFPEKIPKSFENKKREENKT